MDLQTDHQRFQSHPIGNCVAGGTYLIWCAAPDLVGSIQWGIPDERDVREMVELIDFIRHPDLAPKGLVLMDCSDIERVDPDILVGLIPQLREVLPHWSPRIERHAVVVPDGLAGILLAGPLPMLAPSHHFRFVPTLDEALAFLNHPAARAAHDEARALAETVRGTATLVVRLRAALAADLVEATLDRCAAAIAVSTRTLQRELAHAGTSFSDELRRARVAAAKELLRLGGAKHDAIAAQVGFGNSSRMNAALRRELGTTASELRSRPPRDDAKDSE